jgi:hypothetical protein
MPSLILPHLISCDEAGYTGPDLLNPEQPFFSYASHDLSLAEADAVISAARARYRVQMPELKANKLIQSARGRALISDVLDRIEGRYMASLFDKRLSLMSKLFEYIYEPVLQHNNLLFYKNDLHRFVANYLYVLTLDQPVRQLAREFEAFMRSLDPSDAPLIFGCSAGDEPNPLIGQIIRFARGYNVVIARETRHLRETNDSGKWVLDLTATALFTQLMRWGERHPLIEVVCDESKPLLAIGDYFDVMINRPEPTEWAPFRDRKMRTWNMSKPVDFASSEDHAGVQLADLVAGVAAAMPKLPEQPELQPLADKVLPHLDDNCILFAPETVDLSLDEPPVNWLVLEDLAYRADIGADPLFGMEAVYALARATLPQLRAWEASQEAA